MRQLCLRVLAAATVVALAAADSQAQVVPMPPGPVARDCARWPGTVFDQTTSSCLCPQGMWWNMRGDACLPREHAAGEFCAAVWPGSQPLSLAFGYRCICMPPLQWDEEGGACLATSVSGDEECSRQWPGTMPVLSPSGKEFECRCPGGKRWDEPSRLCVDGAPVVTVAPGLFPPPAPGAVPSPAPGGAPPPAHAPAEIPGGPPPSLPEDPGQPDTGPMPAPPEHQPGIPPVRAAPNGNCEGMLAEIRGLAAAGRAAQADSLGMKAAVAGCDPAAISEAARVKKTPPPPARR